MPRWKQLLVCAVLTLGNGALAAEPEVRTGPVRQAVAEKEEPASTIDPAGSKTAQTALALLPVQKGEGHDAPYRNGGYFGGNFTDE